MRKEVERIGIEKNIMKNVVETLNEYKGLYSCKTDFIRDAIRCKINEIKNGLYRILDNKNII